MRQIIATTVASSSVIRRLLCTTAIASYLVSPASAADELSIALAGIEYGASVGSLLYTTSEDKRKIETAPDAFSKLALRVQAKINEGRASSNVVASYFAMQTTALTYAAALDPEPFSKGTAAVAAWGSKLAGDAITKSMLDQAQEQARSILAQGLKQSKLSNDQLRAMTPEQLRAKVGDFQIGGRKMREILADNPQALSMLEAESVDLATNIGVEALARSTAIGADVNAVKSKVSALQKNLKEYQDAMTSRLTTIEKGLGAVAESARVAHVKIDELKQQVGANTAAIQSLAAVSYSGWSTDQKLQAVQSGLFPEITGETRTKLTESLKAQQSFESAVANVQLAASSFGSLATIAGNLGVSSDVVQKLQGAQIVAGSVAKFATGDVLGGVAGLTSLVGLGAPDAAAQRHAETMQYLRQAFAQVNKKLDEIIDLQTRTLTAIVTLAKAQEEFRQQVTRQLDRIELTVLQNQQMLQSIVLQRWSGCYALFYGSTLNGQFLIPTRADLVSLLKTNNLSTWTADCYRTFTTFLDANVKPANWAGDIIAANDFPTEQIIGDAELQKAMKAYQSEKDRAYSTARAFLLRALQAPGSPPQALVLARLMQPTVDVNGALKLNNVLFKGETVDRFNAFKCNDADLLAAPLVDLLCVGVLSHSAKAPVKGRLQNILGAPLIGPNAFWLLDMGVSLSTVVEFANRSNDGTFRFVDPERLTTFVSTGPSPEMKTALGQGKGVELLGKLRWLSDAALLQQSLIYGDYLALLIEQCLYDPEKKALVTDPQDPERKTLVQLGLAAMKANPVLARNVLMLAMRHAVEDQQGGAAKAQAVSYQQTFFGLGLSDYISADTCGGLPFTKQKLTDMFPNFVFEYRATTDDHKSGRKKDCPLEVGEIISDDKASPGLGAGVSVGLADFYIKVPSPMTLARGAFEQTDGLRLALAYRDRVSQAFLDRTIAGTFKASVADASELQRAALASQFLGKAWTWNGREKSKQ
ncbi:hypothetical protein IVA79_34720 [Bradyrhizobium sp. 138]|uniref:hypothetical protein n=1 Tax=Bradyrhizobium sp. 138 TaxID=2782615 RepID=UPI001FF70600|nr:hypothetical protein [Bradyrhizobium sp. 138]MCK1738987.1 hypothetical protein [Bradyrhizobium sp. 138]